MKPIVLCILDGIGLNKQKKGNAFKQAKTPNFDKLWNQYPHSKLIASGQKVGLPAGQIGNSEVGHTNIGAGRVVYQSLEYINNQIKKGSFFENQKILDIMNYTKNNNSNLHILGLLSDGGIHSHINHLFSIIDMCQKNDIKNVYLHLFTDGRDTKTKCGINYLEQLQEKIKNLDFIKIATISGRYYAMDRDDNYDRIRLAYDAIVNASGVKYDNASSAINTSYENDITDEFIVPSVIENVGVNDNDGLLVFNFRSDRLRCLLTAITNDNFDKFETKKLNIKLITMMPVSDSVISESAFKLDLVDNALGTYLSEKGIRQLRIAETEKYAHVTYFFDGGLEKDLKNCTRLLIPSPKVATYDLTPEMSAYEITEKLVEIIEQDKYDFVVLNYANGDMVGHTGNLEACIKAVEAVDECLGKIYDAVLKKDGKLIVTADHGNCEEMIDKNGDILTNHTNNKVPFIVTDKKLRLKNGKLGDIAPTILHLMGLEVPKEMNGEVLIENSDEKNKKIFVILSIIVLALTFSVYACRFVYYYNIENGPQVKNDKSLVAKIINNNEIVTDGSGLYNEDNSYVFKGQVDNNYIYYSGKLWRIIKINGNKTIKLISDDIVSSLVWNYQNNEYEDSYVRSWLNKSNEEHTGIFYDTLNKPDEYLSDVTFCIDKLSGDDLEKCDDAIIDKIGLIGYKEYKDAYAYKGYLNNSKYFWTINGSENNVWYIYNEGGINDKSHDGDSYYAYGLRPVITLKDGLEFVVGDGTIDNPYIIDNNELNSGSYIMFSGYRWRIVMNENDKIKIVMDEYIKEDENAILKSFGTDNNYDINNYSSLANYLNNIFYQSLENKEWILDGIWYNGTYSSDTNYDYKNVFTSQITAKVGLLNISDPYVTDLPSVTMTKANEEMIYAVMESGNLYANQVSDEFNVRPALYITGNLSIASGSGTKNDPYVVGVK